eukprot:COSAG02_NODE_5942_length_3926_cov_2.792004_1_plen_231_part_00
MHTDAESADVSVSVAVGDDHHVSYGGTDGPSENGQADEFLPHLPPQLAGHVKRTAELKEPGRKNVRAKGSQDRQPLLPLLFSGVNADADAEAATFLPAGGRHIAARKRTREASSGSKQEGRANEDESDLSEEMEALRRARLSRQITEDRIGKESLSGRRKTCILATETSCTHTHVWALPLPCIPGFACCCYNCTFAKVHSLYPVPLFCIVVLHVRWFRTNSKCGGRAKRH